MAQPARAGEREDVVADALGEPAVVGDDDERARPAVEQVLERGQRVDVEVVRRLVEQQDVRALHQQPHELEPAALAAGEVAHRRPRAVAAEAEAVAQQRGGDLLPVAERRLAADGLERLEHAQVAGDLRRVLGQQREPHRGAALDRARVRRQLPGEQPQQRRLARAVDADERRAVARTEPPGEVAQDAPPVVGDRHVLGVEHAVAEPRGGEPQQLGPVARRRLVGDQRVGGLDPEARLGRPRRRPAPQPRELLAQQPAAPLLAHGGEPLALGAGEHVRGVAALVPVDGAVGHLPRGRADRVEEPAVVGDDEQRAAARGEMAREPVDGLDVEVVRRLVEQQQLRRAEQHAAERDPPPLAAREPRDRRVETVREPVERNPAEQPVEHGAEGGVARPLVVGAPADQLGADRAAVVEVVVLAEQRGLGAARSA